MLKIYGLKSCDTCRKARRDAQDAGIPATFIDIRESPLDPATLDRFLAAFGDDLVNKRSTTWRALSEADRAKAPRDLLENHPALMKRPVVEGTALTLGWTSEARAAHIS